MHAERHQMKVRSWFAAAAFFGIALVLAAQAKAASVGTDGVDYAAGDVVHISGSGWTPGEVVELTIALQRALDRLASAADPATGDDADD